MPDLGRGHTYMDMDMDMDTVPATRHFQIEGIIYFFQWNGGCSQLLFFYFFYFFFCSSSPNSVNVFAITSTSPIHAPVISEHRQSSIVNRQLSIVNRQWSIVLTASPHRDQSCYYASPPPPIFPQLSPPRSRCPKMAP